MTGNFKPKNQPISRKLVHQLTLVARDHLEGSAFYADVKSSIRLTHLIGFRDARKAIMVSPTNQRLQRL